MPSRLVKKCRHGLGSLSHYVVTVPSLALLPATVYAQRPVMDIPDRIACHECGVVLGRPTTLQQRDSASELIQVPVIAVDGRRNIVVLQSRRNPPTIFDSTGRFVRTIGRNGEGPGEYRAAEIVLIGELDTAYVIDRSTRRMSILSPTWRYVRSFPVPDAAYSAALTREGSFVVSASLSDRARFGKPFHILDQLGNYQRSFGDQGDPVVPGGSPPLVRIVTKATSAGFWSVSALGQYSIEHWTSDGNRLSALRRTTPWFRQENKPRYTFSADVPPSPFIISAVQDSSGLIWTSILVHDARWREVVRWDNQKTGELASVPTITDRDLAYDVLIEVIDPVKGVLLTTHRLDESWAAFAAPGVLMLVNDQESGLEIQIRSISLSRRRQ